MVQCVKKRVEKKHGVSENMMFSIFAEAQKRHIHTPLQKKTNKAGSVIVLRNPRCRNPRCYQTYIDESFVGRMCRVMANSQDGPFHDALQMTTLEKYLTALSIQFSFDD